MLLVLLHIHASDYYSQFGTSKIAVLVNSCAKKTNVLVSLGCHTKIPEPGWLNQQKCVSPFWRLEVQVKVLGGLVLVRAPFLVCRWPPLFVHMGKRGKRCGRRGREWGDGGGQRERERERDCFCRNTH